MELYSFEGIIKEMLALVPDNIDKREGSIIYNTLAPVALFISRQRYMMMYMTNLLFADTAEGEWLDRVTNDFGVEREQATKAIRQINTFDSNKKPINIDINSRFAIGDITLIIKEKITDGQFKAECEQEGTNGNRYGGEILPIDNINGLGTAELIQEPLIPARDTESDESLRGRFYLATRQSPFGGNKADYEQKTLEIDGVGAVEIFTARTQGAGNIGLVIGDEQGNKATQTLIDTVQKLYGINGDGLAPIGHFVTVATSVDLPVNVVVPIKLKTGTSFELIKPIVENTVRDYISNIPFKDATVFHAKLVAAILNCHDAIIDVGTVKLNNSATNLAINKTFENYQVPTVSHDFSCGLMNELGFIQNATIISIRCTQAGYMQVTISCPNVTTQSATCYVNTGARISLDAEIY